MARPSDRDDVLQEIVLRLWQLYGRYDVERPFTPRALGVAARRMKEELRKEARRPLLLEPAAIERMAAVFEEQSDEESGADEQAALVECLAALPASSSLLIRGRYFTRRSIEDLASDSGQSIHQLYAKPL